MGKVVYALGVSLDGYMEGANGDISWTNPGEDLFRFHVEQTRRTALSLYGRGLYETMAAYWPTADADPEADDLTVEFARLWRELPKVVFSTTLDEVGWNSRLVRGDIAREVTALKERTEGVMDVGGAGLGTSLMRLGLIDEYQVFVYPVILGGGKSFFTHLDRRIPLRLEETRTFDHGVVHSRYAALSS